jgi:mono/diheme cytochrome c family protein
MPHARVAFHSFRVLILSIVGSLSCGAAAPGATPDDFEHRVLPYFKQHCIRCHGPEKEEGELRVDKLSTEFAKGIDAGHWADLIERLSAGEMPPEDEPQPHADETAAVVEFLSGKLKEGEAARLARRDRVSLHKLTREEYANTIFDLLGVQYDYADPTGLSEDPDYHGFERIGSVLSLAPSHVEKYMNAAETALAEAFPAAKAEKFIVRKDAYDLRGPGMKREDLEAMGKLDKLRVEMWPGHDLQGGRPGPGRSLPVAGLYKVRVKLSGMKPANQRAPHLTFYCPTLDRMLFETDVITTEEEPTIVEFTAHLPAGNHSYVVTNDVPGPSTLPRSGRSGNKPFFSIKDGRLPWQLKLTDDNFQPIIPFLILDWIEWEGPLESEALTYAQQQYLPTTLQVAPPVIPADPKTKPAKPGPLARPAKPFSVTPTDEDWAEVRACLQRFMVRAYRRPVSAAEIARLETLIDEEYAAGESFEASIKTALLAVLCSKDFLYLVEGSPDQPVGNLNDFELASRLSYFLWATMPDEELFEAARNGTLHTPEVLKAQTRRMLADPRSARFATAFPRQWLQLKMVGMFPPDKKLYPDYDDYLQRSMIAEVTGFFGEVLKQNLTLREFIDSNWTVMNARLAEHYGCVGVNGSEFVKVSLQPEQHRGGVLTQAAILALTSDGTRHRPVHRGKWLSESILGKSPPPPPANVKPIEPTPADQPKATLRMKLDAHKADATCAACHRKIDPLGLAFDNYDAIGRWRTEEVVGDGVGSNPKVDASGELPDGRKFADAAEFKQLLMSDLDKFNTAFVEKLATFAMRRTMTMDDKARLAEVAAAGKKADYRVADLIEALVLSDLFQQR